MTDSASASIRPPSKLRRRLIAAAIIALLASGAALLSTSRSSSETGRTEAGKPESGKSDSGRGETGKKGDAPARAVRPVPVLAEAARTGEIRVYLNGIGSVMSLATVSVRSRVDGELLAVHYREGQVVRAGELLAEIDPRPYQEQLTQSEGEEARDAALLANARIDLERTRVLVAQGSVPKQDGDTAESLARQYEGAVKADRAKIESAKLELAYCRITAPIGGRLGLRLIDAGNLVRAVDAAPLVVIAQVQPIAVVFTLAEDNLPPILERLHTGEPLSVEAYDREGTRKLATGNLLTIDNQIDPATGTVRLKAEFPNQDSALFPNQFVNARLLLEVRKEATLIPAAAIQRGVQGPFVYVVKGDLTVEQRPVKIGVTEGDDASIDSGLAAGDRVVVDGADGLRKGGTVSIRSRAAASAPPEKP